jgi:2-polyprenyl-3-methyl-5-hydroxy-6-metoxy-1,4-benzoquinol methylase
MGDVEREDWDRKHAEAGLLFGAEPNRFLVAEVGSLPPGRALDVACGAGRNAVWLAERGWAVTGVDFSGVALANARRLAAGRGVTVEWVQADVREWQPEAAASDFVAVLYLQLPAAERRLVLGRAAEAVAPGGTLLVVTESSPQFGPALELSALALCGAAV